MHTKSAFGSYDLTYHLEKGVLYANRHWTLAKKEVPQADWKKYKSWTDGIALGTTPYVQLRSPGGASAGTNTHADAATSSSSVADTYLDEAAEAMRIDHLDQAEELLQKAKKADPGHAVLAGDFGYIAWRRGNHPEAIRLYREEIQNHPDTSWAYGYLSKIQLTTGDHDGAVDTLRRFIKVAPRDPQAAASLIAVLTLLHRHQEALAAANDSLARLPSDAQSNAQFLGAVLQAQLDGGDKERGAATAAALLSNTTDENLQNSAAYALAVAGVNLPLAESTIRSTLDKLTSETQAWTLDESPTLLRARSSLLAAAWDTLGYVFLKQGRPAEAVPYIRACWLGLPSAEVGEHLGDAEAATGDLSGARQTYELALSTVPHYDDMGIRITRASQEEQDLRGRLAHLKEPGPPLSEAAATQQLQALRTIPLSSLPTDGTAEYRLLLNAHGVQKVALTGSKTLPGAEELLRRVRPSQDFFPPGSVAQIVRRGMLNCHNRQCELVLLP